MESTIIGSGILKLKIDISTSCVSSLLKIQITELIQEVFFMNLVLLLS